MEEASITLKICFFVLFFWVATWKFQLLVDRRMNGKFFVHEHLLPAGECVQELSWGKSYIRIISS